MTKIVGWLAGAVGVLALVLSSVGIAAAEPDPRFPPPFDVRNTSSAPGCLAIYFDHSASGVYNFGVAVDNGPMVDVGTNNHRDDVCNLAAGSKHSVKVCAQYGTSEGPVACTEPPVDLWTAEGGPGVGEMVPGPPQGPLPVPPVKPIQDPGTTEFGVEWGWKGTNDGHTYDYYNIRITPEGGEHRYEKHNDDGNWGWQPITNLKPGTTYSVSVEGCDIDPVPYTNDDCSGWSPAAKVTTKPYPLHSGADTCLPGFVWREAFNGDTVCVPPPRRDAVKADNAAASSRLSFGGNCTPGVNCTFTAPDTCKQGFVWREADPADHVCVSYQERDLVKQENANPKANRAQP